MEENQNYLPVDLFTYLKLEKGYSLIIKGPPGSGKTTLALQILSSLEDNIKSIYLSTRIGDKSLYKQFSWLKGYERKIKILVSSEAFLSEIYKEEKEKSVKNAAKNVLKEINKEKQKEVSRLFFNEYFKSKKAPEISLIYKDIEMNLPAKTILVVDSIEGITNRYGLKEAEFTYMIQKDLVETADVTAIFISEENYPTPEDYVADGEIYLNYVIDESRRFRTIKINKFRGKEITQSSYPFTLNQGIFKIIFPINEYNIGKWEPKKEINDLFSTGIEELDKELKGGIRPGSFVNIEVSNIVPLEILRIIQSPLILNSFSTNKSLLIVSEPGTPYEFFKSYFNRWIPKDIIDSNLVYVDYAASTSKGPNHIALGGIDLEQASKLHRDIILEFLQKKEKSLSIIHHDSMEYIYGPELALRNIFSNISKLKNSDSVAISFTKPGQKINPEIKNISDYLFKLITLENGIFLYGIKPKTVYFAIEIDRKKGFPNLNLIPIV